MRPPKFSNFKPCKVGTLDTLYEDGMHLPCVFLYKSNTSPNPALEGVKKTLCDYITKIIIFVMCPFADFKFDVL